MFRMFSVQTTAPEPDTVGVYPCQFLLSALSGMGECWTGIRSADTDSGKQLSVLLILILT